MENKSNILGLIITILKMVLFYGFIGFVLFFGLKLTIAQSFSIVVISFVLSHFIAKIIKKYYQIG